MKNGKAKNEGKRKREMVGANGENKICRFSSLQFTNSLRDSSPPSFVILVVVVVCETVEKKDDNTPAMLEDEYALNYI